jgi:hypothetical protein
MTVLEAKQFDIGIGAYASRVRSTYKRYLKGIVRGGRNPHRLSGSGLGSSLAPP